MPASVLRIIAGLVCLVMAIVALPVAPAAASTGPRVRATVQAKHAVAKAVKGASVERLLRDDACGETWASVIDDGDDDDDDEDLDDGDGVTPDPDDFGLTSRLALPGPTERVGTTFRSGPSGRAATSTRQLPEDPP